MHRSCAELQGPSECRSLALTPTFHGAAVGWLQQPTTAPCADSAASTCTMVSRLGLISRFPL